MTDCGQDPCEHAPDGGNHPDAMPPPDYDEKGRPILTPGEQEEAIKLYDPETKHIAQDPKPEQGALFYDRESGALEDVDGNEVKQYIEPQQVTPGGPVHGGYTVLTPTNAVAATEAGMAYAKKRYPTDTWQTVTVLNQASLEDLTRTLLNKIAPDWAEREDMKGTPRRWAAQLQELTTPDEAWNFTTFPSKSDEMVVLGPIPFYTLCAHHVIPFYGKAYIGYVPNERVAGLSKLPRLVKMLAKGLWMQEELTASIADYLQVELEPLGIAIILEGEHMCMAMRGVETPGVVTTTSAMRGVFLDHGRTAKQEFMQIIKDYRG